MTPPSMTRRGSRWALGLGLTTCVIACAAPWLFALGGGALLASSATFAVVGAAEHVAVAMVALGLLGLGVASVRRRCGERGSACGCETTCSVAPRGGPGSFAFDQPRGEP